MHNAIANNWPPYKVATTFHKLLTVERCLSNSETRHKETFGTAIPGIICLASQPLKTAKEHPGTVL